jgi:LysM repeat protein
MTREAKIGLLTGLGVIVLIGVLLSEYLGGPAPGTAAGQNRMAALPIGSSYREKVMQPVGVPSMVRGEGGTNAPADGPTNGTVMNQVAGLPTAYAADSSTPTTGDVRSNAGEVAIASPVTPIADGQVRALAANGPTDRPPTIELNDLQTISIAPTGQPVAAKTVQGEQYVIVAGDSLSKIAKKFYRSSKVEDQQRIVAANPGMLKNTGTILIAGKKLLIPGVPSALAAVPAPDRKADAKTDGRSVVIRSPGQVGRAAGNTSSDARRLASAADFARKDVVKTAGTKNSGVYVVQDGDTLERIARKVSPSHAVEVAKQIAMLNKIKDPRGLQVGQRLRLPAN